MKSVLGVLFFAVALAVVAYIWQPLWQIAAQTRGQLSTVAAWNIQGSGTILGTRISGDLVKREDGTKFLRLSYPLARIINNQWIFLDNVEGNSGLELFPHLVLRLTKNLPTVAENGVRFKRVAFELRQFNMPILPGVERTEGILWFAKGNSLPARVSLVLFTSAGKGGELQLELSYLDRFGTAASPSSRLLSEVISQFNDIARSKASMPKRVPSLAQGASLAGAFNFDFDQDGLSDGLELFYGTDPGNPDTDSDKVLDGEEIRRGTNPVDNEGLNK